MISGTQHDIINNAESPHVMLKSTNIGDCRWTDGFWADKNQLCQEVMMPHTDIYWRFVRNKLSDKKMG
jgi:hypothetical protein